MRLKLLGLVLGVGIAAAAVVPAFACEYYNRTNAAAEQSQQTAQVTSDQHSN